jgi:hypothetical protein
MLNPGRGQKVIRKTDIFFALSKKFSNIAFIGPTWSLVSNPHRRRQRMGNFASCNGFSWLKGL